MTLSVGHLISVALIVLGGVVIIRTIPSFTRKRNLGDFFGDEAVCIAVGVLLVVAGCLVWLVPVLVQ